MYGQGLNSTLQTEESIRIQQKMVKSDETFEISHVVAFSEHFRKLSFLSKSKIELSKATFDTPCNKINKAL